jgi:hypothetical protein
LNFFAVVSEALLYQNDGVASETATFKDQHLAATHASLRWFKRLWYIKIAAYPVRQQHPKISISLLFMRFNSGTISFGRSRS